jgi:hypothetical protein
MECVWGIKNWEWRDSVRHLSERGLSIGTIRAFLRSLPQPPSRWQDNSQPRLLKNFHPSRLRNDIHSNQPKQRSGGEKVFVVGMNFREAAFCRSSEMEGIGGAELGGGWGDAEDGFDAVNDGVGEGKQDNLSGGQF